MPDPVVHISEQETAEADRFDRFRLISWWDQAKLSSAKVVVIGAGALGNEIIKNLALLGIGNLFIADLDRIENSNLSRSVLYRAQNNGQFKATVAADSAKDIYPQIKAQSFNGNAVYDLGMGIFRWADVILGGLDNREARLSINRACWRVNRPWIDGAIEQIQGCARVFIPDGPCYECTMSETDWKLLRMRRSCNLLSAAEMATERTPTTPTISAIIAGVQCQEAVKILHGMETIRGRGWIFSGMSTDSYQIEYQRKDDCYSHDMLQEIIELDSGVDNITVGDLLARAKKHLGPSAEIEFARDVLQKLVCPSCKKEEELYSSLGKVSSRAAVCPNCPDVRREAVTFYKVRGNENFLDKTPAQIGVPPFDIIIARAGARSIGLEFTGDAPAVLGPLWSGEDLEWT